MASKQVTAYHFSEQAPGAPLVIFLHGFPDDSSTWSYQFEFLKNEAELWAPDLYEHNFDEQIEIVSSFIELQTNQRQIFLIAHDMGGPIATEVFRKKPEIIVKLIFLNTLGLEQFLGRYNSAEQILRSSYMFLFCGPLYETKWWQKGALKFLKLVYDLGRLPKDDELRSGSEKVIEGIKRYRDILTKIPGKIVFNPGRITRETHFLFGLKDPFLVVPSQKEFAKHFDKTTLKTISAGHWPHRSHSAEVNEWLKRIIRNE